MATYSDLPGPKTIPFLGVGVFLKKEGCDYLCRLTREFGRLVKFPLPGIRGVLVSDKELIKTVLLKTERQFYKGPIYKILEPVVGRGLVTNQGSSWRQQRRHLNPLFQPQALPESRLSPILERSTERLLAQINQSIARGVPLDTSKAMMELTFSVLIEAFFSGDLSGEYEELNNSFSVIQNWIGKRFVSVLRPPLMVPTPSNLALRQALKILKSAIDRLQAKRSSYIPHHEADRRSHDLLDTLLQARDHVTGQPLSSQQILDEIITFLIAGHDTTALTLSYTLALFAQNHYFVQDLIDGLWSNDVVIQKEALSKLEWGILESMRIYPAVYMINRANKEPFSYGGYDFEPHTTFFVAQIATHRDPEYWPDPLSFKPERFATGIPDDFRYFPFAGGPRTCLGNNLAMIEALGVLKRLLKHFKPIKVHQSFTLRPNLTSIPDPSVTLWWEKSR